MLYTQPVWSLSKKRHCIENDIIYEADTNEIPQEIITPLAETIKRGFMADSLDVSKYSYDKFGRSLAYENLYLDGYPLLSVFCSGFVGRKGGPYPELQDMSVSQAQHYIDTYQDQIIRYWYNDGNRSFEFTPENKGVLAYMDFLYIQAISQNVDLMNLKYILQQYTYITDVSYISGSTILTPAKAICFLKFLLCSSYAGMFEEVMIDQQVFIKLHQQCFRKEVRY